MFAPEPPPMMDAHTLGLLEFDKIRDLLAGYTAGPLGAELARALESGTDLKLIAERQALVTEMVAALGQNQAPPFGGLHDVRLVVRRAAIGTMLSAEQLLHVAETLNCTGAMYRYRMRLDQRHTRLIELLGGIEDLGPVARTISGCIDGRGQVLDMASRDLAAVRQKLFELDDKVKAEVKRLLRDPELRKILNYPNATVNGDHYVLPVAVNHRHKIPGVVHRVSSTGETVFVEPASVAHLSAERVSLKAEEDRAVKRVLRRLSQEVGRVARPLSFALDIFAKLDLITAMAQFSRAYDMQPPELNREGRLWLRAARHPLLLHLFRTTTDQQGPREVVPIEVRLGFGFNMLVITGPNTGGKTVTLKTTGLLALMAQCGMHIPANVGSALPIFDGIFADIGDEQSLTQSLSTFSSHITRIANIFDHANANSLVLFDELGSGTDPTEGAALGRAILDELDLKRCRAIVTTHLGGLKTYAFNNERAENGAVEFDIETLRPTYRLQIGQFGMSNAIRIARRLNLPEPLLKRAESYLDDRTGSAPELTRLQELREEAEKARAEALVAQHAATVERDEFVRKTLAFEQETAHLARLNGQRLSLQPNDTVHVTRFDATGRVVRVNALKNTVTVRVGIGQWEVPFDEVFPVSANH